MSDYRDFIAEEQGVNLADDNTLTDEDLMLDELYEIISSVDAICNKTACNDCKFNSRDIKKPNCLKQFYASEIIKAKYTKQSIKEQFTKEDLLKDIIRMYTKLLLKSYDTASDFDITAFSIFLNNLKDKYKIIDTKNLSNSHELMAYRTKGVSYDKAAKKWRAKLQVNYKCIDLGRFKTLQEAIWARRNAEIKYLNKIKLKGNI